MATTLNNLITAVRLYDAAERAYKKKENTAGMRRTDARLEMMAQGEAACNVLKRWLTEQGIWTAGPQTLDDLFTEEEDKGVAGVDRPARKHVKVTHGGHGYYVNLTDRKVHLAGDYLDVTDSMDRSRREKIIAKAEAKEAAG